MPTTWFPETKSSCTWMASVYPEYLIFPGTYHFGFRLRAVISGDSPTALGRTMLDNVF